MSKGQKVKKYKRECVQRAKPDILKCVYAIVWYCYVLLASWITPAFRFFGNTALGQIRDISLPFPR